MDEEALLKAIRNRDPQALTEVFERYAPSLFRYVLRLRHDPLEADDVVGETFSRLLEQLAAGKGPRDNLRSYLYQTAYHVIVDRSRDDKHYSPFEAALQMPAQENLPPEQAEEFRMLGRLYKAINTVLNDDQKNVIFLRYMEGFDLQETADILGKEVNNIKVIQHRALLRLREEFSDEFED